MPGSDLNITLPVVGTDSWPVWADRVTTALTTIINDIEPQIVTSEILENADHDFNGFALTDARWMTFRQGNTTSLPTYGIGFKNGDLWACDSAGNQVQITSAGVLAGVGNGFRGDTAYAKYTASSSLYEFLDSSSAYDDVKANDFIVANGGTASATIGFGGTVNTSFTLPATAASGVSILSIDSSGQVAHNATISTGFTVNNADITLTGTAEIVHPDRTLPVRAASSTYRTSSGTYAASQAGATSNTGTIWTAQHATDKLIVGDRPKSVKVYFNKGDASTLTLTVYKVGSTDSSFPASIASNTSAASGNGSVTATIGSPAALAAGESLVWQVSFAGSAGNTHYTSDVVYDHP